MGIIDGVSDPPLRLLVRIGWLVALVAFAVPQTHGRTVELVLLVGVALAWAGWIAGRGALVYGALVAMGILAGVLALHVGVAVGFFAAVAVAAASRYELGPALLAAACGPVTLALAGGGVTLVAWSAAVALAAFVGGIARRQTDERTRARAELDVERERNRIAREVHDVLAHTLGAVSVQLEAASALLEAGGEPERLRAAIEASRRLVHEGLDDAHAAVRALRDEPVELVERLEQLLEGSPITLEVVGEPRPLEPAAGVTLVRAAQEAVTNVRKHAPGSPATVTIAYGDGETTLTVSNPLASAAGERRLGGYGLQGMRERIELAGGRVSAGPTEAGWTVKASVPA